MTLALLLWTAWSACTPVRGPLLYGRDLADADPQFAGAPADALVGYSPSPGSRRVLSQAEVSRLGVRFSASVEAHELCFEYAMEKLDRMTVQASMEQAIPGAQIQILDSTSSSVPEGRIVFTTASLPKLSQARLDEPVIWRGYVEYAEGRKFAIWAKVQIAVTGPRVMVKNEIAAGQEIAAGDIELRTVRAFPSSEHWVERSEDVVGRRTLRVLRPDSYVAAGNLQAGGQVVMRGDAVTVDVAAGAAHLSLDARAESAAAVGDVVRLRNPKSGKVFEARVTAKGSARLLTPASPAEEKQ